MNRLTTLLLLLAVLGLGALVWLQTEREVSDVPQDKVELFAGLDVASLTRIRIDNLERSIHLSIDRDSTGRWVLTDPIAYPVREDMFVQLLGVLGRNEAWPVPASQGGAPGAPQGPCLPPKLCAKRMSEARLG